MKPFARRERRVFFFVVSNIFHQPFGIAPEGLFFLPSGRLVRRLFSFHFPVAGWLREFNKNPKKGAITWPTEIRILASAKPPIRKLCTTPSPRARVRVRARWTDGISEISLVARPRARVRAREENGKPSEVLAQWRTKKFGGDFDPVRDRKSVV